MAGLVVVFAFSAADLGAFRASGLSALDRELYDGRQRLAAPVLDDRIVIVDIDERSLAEQGRWPWDRGKIAALTEALVDRGGAAVVGFDVVFAERQAGTEDDARLAQALADRPVVLGYYFSSDREGRTSGALPAPLYDGDAARELAPRITHANGFGANLGELQRAARDSGFFNPFLGGGLDPDGVIRALPLLAGYHGAVYDSLAVAVMREYLGNASLAVQGDRLALDGTRGRVELPISAGFTAMVPLAGRGGPGGGRFRYLSATDVLEGRVDWSLLRDRIVLVGTTAPGQTDLRATPVSEVFPGVEIHASLISGALDGRVKQRPVEAPAIGALATLVVAGLLALILPAMGAVGAVLAAVVGAMTLAGLNAIAYSNLGQVLPLAASLAAVLVLGLFNLTAGWFAEGRARRAMVALFGEYVSPELVEQMARDPFSYRIARSTNRELTILFADIRGFTRIAETMEPEALREYINAFDKYIGDAVMAFWGAPVDDPAHADHAVSAALAMQEEVRRMSETLRARGLPPLAVGIGINTGVVRVGDMGSNLRRAYTVIGDAVNLASRLEGLTKQYEVPIIVGEGTVQRCRQNAFFELARATVAGRAESVRVFVPKVAREATGEGAATLPMTAPDRTPTNAREALHEGTSPGV
jgi:adenylate cyclase